MDIGAQVGYGGCQFQLNLGKEKGDQ